MEYNEFGCPVGIRLTNDEELMMRQARDKKRRNVLPTEEEEKVMAYFAKKYPQEPEEPVDPVDPEGSSEPNEQEDAQTEEVSEEGSEAEEAEEAEEDLIGEDLTIDEMKAALDEAGVSYNPNARDATIIKKYNALPQS